MSKPNKFSVLTLALLDKTLTKEELLKKVQQDFGLIDFLFEGVGHSKAAVRYGCSNVLISLSVQNPEKLYPHFDFFVNLLGSKHRILTWNALAIIANLTKVDVDKKFDAVFDKYYSYLGNEYMVTVANVVGNSVIIALAKPYLTPRIVDELLTVDSLSVTPHLTEECKRVIAQGAIKSFDQFFNQVQQKERVISFVKRHENSSRKKLKTVAEKFLKKWN